jgi:protein-tyrosine phosphatase
MMRFLRRKSAEPPAISVRVLLVCMGNICRSPMAEGVLRQRVAALELPVPVEIDSAGTHGYHENAPPDPRAQSATLRRGIDISRLRARQVVAGDFERFDLLLAMDDSNLEVLLEEAGDEHRSKVRRLLDFAALNGATGRNVPDPYYGGMLGFERVLDLVEEAMPGLLNEIQRLAAERAVQSRLDSPLSPSEPPEPDQTV